jgi:cation diffusion facilitator CzcD-associated flavoprotein CzcO
VNAVIGNDCEVAVVGAGPYGLATAAHLKSAKIATRVFGQPMSFWRQHMPEGMRLRSPWAASHIAHPKEEYSLEAYAAMRGFEPLEQMPVTEFIRYGCWFQAQAVPDLDMRKVVSVEQTQHGFRLRLEDGEFVRTSRVVIAMGLANQDFRPAPFAGLPRELVSHSSDHVTFDAFRGQRVAVIGRGQSACETAALLTEAGADVELISRGPVQWLPLEKQTEDEHDPLWWLRRRMMTRGAVGPFPLNWLAEAPGLAHLLPSKLREEFSLRCLRPKASGWLRPRFGAVRIKDNRAVARARTGDNGVTLELSDGVSTVDRVVLGTGYKIDIARLGIFAPALLQKIALADGAPRLSGGLQSNVPGLHFVGATAVHSFGPLLRFVWGAGFAARGVTRAVLADRARGSAATTAQSEGAPVLARP